MSFCLILALASFAVAKPTKPVIREFTTGPFVVNCKSTGQVCTPGEPLTFTLPRSGRLTKVFYKTAKAHCSAIRLSVRLKGKKVAMLPRLDVGDATTSAKTDVKLQKGKTTLRFRAKGFVGGCNAGQLGSWGGKVKIVVKLPG